VEKNESKWDVEARRIHEGKFMRIPNRKDIIRNCLCAYVMSLLRRSVTGMWLFCSHADGSPIFVTVPSERIICNLVHRFNG